MEGPTEDTAGLKDREVTASGSPATPLAKTALYLSLFYIIQLHANFFFFYKRKVLFLEKKNF